jgi:hypothetical protein
VANATVAAQLAAGVEVSGDAANTPTVVTSPTGDVSAVTPGTGGISIGIKLPATPKANSATVNGAMVMSSTDSSVAVVNPTVGGLQVAQDITGPSAPTSYQYKLTLPPGYKPVVQSNQMIALTSAKGSDPLSAANTIGFVDPAWAVDANGANVPTSYSVSGKTITQTVNTSSVTAWPVVADPSISFGWVIYVHWFHKEVGSILLQAFFAGVGAAGAAACTLISVGFLVPVCLFLFGFATAAVVAQFNTAYSRGGGIVWEFTWTGSPYGYEYVGDNWT